MIISPSQTNIFGWHLILFNATPTQLSVNTSTDFPQIFSTVFTCDVPVSPRDTIIIVIVNLWESCNFDSLFKLQRERERERDRESTGADDHPPT